MGLFKSDTHAFGTALKIRIDIPQEFKINRLKNEAIITDLQMVSWLLYVARQRIRNRLVNIMYGCIF